jgi:2-haloacid dehalogenase
MSDTSIPAVEALFFDVFGTMVDWRTSIAREARVILAPLGHELDWEAFADAWRAEYQPGMEEVRSDRIPFSKLDVLHRRNLERFLPRFGVTGLSDEVRHRLTLSWHRLDAILGAEVAGDYKPKPGVYLAACAALDLPPERCMMVAAHSHDLASAAACGLRTGHIARPNEHGPGTGEMAPTVPVDVFGSDLADLASKLGV